MPAKTKKRPEGKPRLSAERVLDYYVDSIMTSPHCDGAKLLAYCPVGLVINRGYYLDTIGRLKVNDFGVWDDAGWLVDFLTRRVLPFNWNADPSAKGWNKGVGKFYAQLMPGVWPFRLGPHRGRPNHARQMIKSEADERDLDSFFDDERKDGKFQVRRVEDDNVGKLEWGYQAINVHEGSKIGTGSWGCQTLPDDQWSEFSKALYSWMRHDQSFFVACLREDRLS